MSASGGSKAVVAALAANVGIAVIKFVAFLITRSSSMLAESVHSLVDSGNQGLLLLGRRRAQQSATPEHPFGYGRNRYVFGFLVALCLFSVGGLFALYEGVQKIRHPHHLDSPWVAVGVLLAAIVLEGLSFRTAIAESRELKGEASWVQFIRRAKVPELPVVLLEDFAALIGLALALLGVGLTSVTDQPVWDGIGTTCIGVLLIAVAVVLIVETQSLLLGESASPVMNEQISGALVGHGILRIIHLRTMHLGPDELLVAAKVSIDGATTLAAVAQIIDSAERRIRSAVPIARVIYLEPDLDRTASPRSRLLRLDPVIRNYGWGSRTVLPELLGVPADGRPWAELWVGAHPDGPSPAADAGNGAGATTLDRWIAADPTGRLGAEVSARFGERLPFLLKVLSADQALSIQVHPNPAQARSGFAEEERRGIAPDAPGRNYRDDNHKPELLCALGPFDAFCGIRPHEQTREFLSALSAGATAEQARVLSELDQLLAESGPRAVFSALLDSSADSRTETLAALTAGYRRLADSDSPWAATATACRTAADDFPGDIGGALVLLLNYLRLRPGEAMYLSAGMVHAYLRGTGVEVLASSDNVLRCGLTAKNVDVAELMRVADFSEVSDPRSPGRTIGPVGVDYRVPVPDFRLRVLGLTGPGSASDDALVLDAGEPALVLSLGGPAEVADGNERLTLQSGQAAFVSAGPDPVTVRGRVAVASTG